MDNNYFFSLIDLNQNTIVSKCVKRGQGPNEVFGMPTPITIVDKNNFCFYDPNKRKVFNVNFSNNKDPHISQNNKFKTKTRSMDLLQILNGKFVAIGLFDKGRYLVMDSLGNELSYNFDYPVIKNETQLSNAHKAMAFQGVFKRKPTGDKLVFAAQTSQLIEILQIDIRGEMKMKFQWHGVFGKYTPYGDGKKDTSAAISNESSVEFLNTYATNDYIYLLYSGRIIGNDIVNAYKAKTIFVIDWDGHPVMRYNLDIDVKYFAVSDDDKILYAIAEQDDTNLVKFKIDH